MPFRQVKSTMEKARRENAPDTVIRSIEDFMRIINSAEGTHMRQHKSGQLKYEFDPESQSILI